ncbi:MAG: hypothetical protein D6737_03940 [Chloroflexi bacterium]|nr:MAG: hypothetical protein CUN54_00535 [Phototrophicales bacterium]RMF81796.1 MAG: hypothetical protein D6737_03940 [Chloroflexota bacterium]
MDINQAARLIEWLDEERRRDKATIITLEERLAQQQETIDALARRVNSVESDHTTLKTEMKSGGFGKSAFDQIRQEVQQTVEAVEARRLTAEREIERRAELARENIARPVRDLTDKVNEFGQYLSELSTIQAERERLISTVQILQQHVEDLSRRFEEPDKRLTFLEEQRRQDARRISEIQSETPEIQRQIDNLRPKLDLIEDLSLRNERRIQEILSKENERREQIQQFLDQQNLLLHERDQQIEDLSKRFGEQDSAMKRNMERFETWEATYRTMKQIVEDFERIGDRLERRINEVAEMQRLSEERFRQEWNDWTSDDQKRWKQFTLSNDEIWRIHDKEFERFAQRVVELENKLPTLADGIERLWNLERQRAELYRERYQAMLLENDATNANNVMSPPPETPTTNGSGSVG